MNRRLRLSQAATAAGITEDQAEAFVRAITEPSVLQADAGSGPLGLSSLAFSQFCPPRLAGHTKGEVEQIEATLVWRRMTTALLQPDDFAPWASATVSYPYLDDDKEGRI